MLERHRNDNSNYKPTLFQTLNLDVSIQSKGKLGILLMKRVNEGYVVCNVKHYSPLSGTLEKGDLITNWDNTHLGTVSTSDLANIVEKSQTDGFFRLRVKRGIRSASGSATLIGKNSSDIPVNKSGPFQKDIQSETAKKFAGDIEQQSKNKRRLEETACHSKTVEKGATEVTESANKKRALESDVMANHTNQSKTLLPTQALAEQLKTLAMPKFVVDEKEMKKAAETTNNKPTLEFDTTAEHANRSKALLLANGKELVLTELKTPAGPKSVSDGKEIKKVIDRTHNKPSLESAIVNKHPNQSIPLLVAQGKAQIPIEQSKTQSIFKFVVDENEIKKAAERTNSKPTLESDTTAAEHTNRNKTLLLANGKELVLTELKTPPIFKSVADGKEMKKTTESMNNKLILESDTTAEHTDRSKTLLLAQDKEQKTNEAIKTVDKHDGHLGGMTRTSKSKANNAIKSTFQKDTPKDGDEMIIHTSENRFANAKISPGQKLGIFLKRNKITSNISVENVLASSPFYSKLEFGDIITHFNEVNLKNKSIQEIKEMFQSYPGCRLRIGFQRFKKNLQGGSPCLKNLEVNHETRDVDVPLGKMTLGLKFQRMSYGMLVLSVSQASCLRGMLDKGDVITHVNSTSIMNDTIQEFSQKVVQSQECRLSVTRVANSFKSSSDETKNPSDIFEIKRRAAASSSKGSKAAQKADSTKSHDPAKTDVSVSVSAIDTAQLTDEQVSSLPYVYAFIVDDERSMQKAEKRNTRLMKHWKKNTKDTPSKNTSSQKPFSRVKNIPVFIGPSKDYKGWTEEVHLKHGSNQRYKYWFSPIKKYKFRTKKGIDSFLDALSKTGGDEDQAFLLIKNELK